MKKNIIDYDRELVYPNTDLSVYVKEDYNNNTWILQIFRGKVKKSILYHRCENFNTVEYHINNAVKNSKERLERKALDKLRKEEIYFELKSNIKIGTILRTSFSYNMTFNKFYKIKEIKGNKLKLEILDTEWADGNIGWTGNVKAGNGTGKYLDTRLIKSGIKIDSDYAHIVNDTDTFYENHLD